MNAAECLYLAVICVLSFGVFVMVMLTCHWYRQWKKEALQFENYQKGKNVVSRDLTAAELENLVNSYSKEEDTEKDFLTWITDYLKEDHSNDPIPIPGPWVDCAGDCRGHECACHFTRADCCKNMGADGQHHEWVNLNILLGIEDVKKRPELLSPKEAKELTDACNKYWSKHPEIFETVRR